MKLQTYLNCAALALMAVSAPMNASAATDPGVIAALSIPPEHMSSQALKAEDGSYELAKKGRGRGGDRDRSDDRRGRDDDDDDDDHRSDRSRDRDDDRSKSSGRSRARIPGGSGCDDPGDILEHPECAGGGNGAKNGQKASPGSSGRKKPRIPGGSGCDGLFDLMLHPECRP